MRKILLPVCAIVLSSLFTSRSAGQVFVGSDNFDSGSAAKWALAFRINSITTGDLSFTNSRLDFSKPTGAGNQFQRWDGDGAGSASRTADSFTNSWVAELTVTNTQAFASGFGTIGIQIVGNSFQYSALMLGSNSTGFFLRSEGSGTQNAFAAVEATTADSTDVRLRLAWDAGTTALTASYSFDSGASFTSIAAASPTTNWTAGTANSGFFFDVFGNSNAAVAITSGSMFADNFSVSAIPEPSTYAAMAGAAALGLAFWRRRKSRNATKI